MKKDQNINEKESATSHDILFLYSSAMRSKFPGNKYVENVKESER